MLLFGERFKWKARTLALTCGYLTALSLNQSSAGNSWKGTNLQAWQFGFTGMNLKHHCLSPLFMRLVEEKKLWLSRSSFVISVMQTFIFETSFSHQALVASRSVELVVCCSNFITFPKTSAKKTFKWQFFCRFDALCCYKSQLSPNELNSTLSVTFCFLFTDVFSKNVRHTDKEDRIPEPP